MLDLTDHIYNNWKVLFKTSDKRWRCKCLCFEGSEQTLSTKDLRNNRNKSCGCLNRKLKQGDKKHRLTVIKYAEDNKYEFQCDCGEKIIILTNSFTSGNTKSCGCLKIEQLAINRAKKKL